jgi:Electron transfer DM13
MKKFIPFLFIAFSFTQCSKSVKDVTETIPTDLTVISQGSFTNGVHSVSGVVKLSKDAAGKKFLVFEDFKTESGPDLRIWLAEDNAGKNYAEITKTVNNGTYKLELASDVDTSKKTYVLVWCKQFTVLFGSAILK